MMLDKGRLNRLGNIRIRENISLSTDDKALPTNEIIMKSVVSMFLTKTCVENKMLS